MQACTFCNISKPMMFLHLKFCLHSNKIKNCSQHATKTLNMELQLIQIKAICSTHNFQHYQTGISQQYVHGISSHLCQSTKRKILNAHTVLVLTFCMQLTSFTFFLSYTSQAIQKKIEVPNFSRQEQNQGVSVCICICNSISCSKAALPYGGKKTHQMRTQKPLSCMKSGFIKLNHTHNITIRIDNIQKCNSVADGICLVKINGGWLQ